MRLTTWPTTAYVDETVMRDAYLLAAVAIDDRLSDELRAIARGLRRTGLKAHWHGESANSKSRMAQMVGELPVVRTAVVLPRQPGEREDRCRLKCIESLLRALDEDVDQIVLEAREVSQNRRDLLHVNHLRHARRIRGQFRVEHKPGPTEPLLWLADVLVGAVRENHADRDRFRQLCDRTRIVRIEP